MFVSFTIFLEAVALIPQLWHLYNHQDPEGLADSYLMFLGGSRFIRFFFWLEMMMEGDTFPYLLIADFVHTGLLIGFYYLFRRTVKSGTTLLGMSTKVKDK